MYSRCLMKLCRHSTRLVSGHGFSRAVGGSQFRALAPAAFLLARYVKQYGNSSGLSTSSAFTGFAAMYSRCLMKLCRHSTRLVSGHGLSRAVGGSQFRALAPAAFLLARYVKQLGELLGPLEQSRLHRVRRYVLPMLDEALPTLHARLGEATLPDLSQIDPFLIQAV